MHLSADQPLRIYANLPNTNQILILASYLWIIDDWYSQY